MFGLEDGDNLTCEVPDLTGAAALRVSVRRAGRRVTAETDGEATGAWQVQLAGVRAPGRPGGGLSATIPSA